MQVEWQRDVSGNLLADTETEENGSRERNTSKGKNGERERKEENGALRMTRGRAEIPIEENGTGHEDTPGPGVW